MKLGLALSGGGTRAIVFHLGVLKALAETAYWDDIKYLSTVSGGSLCVALIMSQNNNKWPTKEVYIQRTLPKLKEMMISSNYNSIQKRLLNEGLFFIGLRANYLSFLLNKIWKIKGNLNDLPETPRWAINCTCWETGKNWRFERKRMGDYVANYVLYPDFPLEKAVAASAAYPWGIGTLKIKTSNYSWEKYVSDSTTESTKPLFKYLSLWDGGIYENLGVECFFSPDHSKRPKDWLKRDIDFCIVCDASQELITCKRNYLFFLPLPQWLKSRIADIATDQTRSIRARWLFNYFQENQNGIYIRMGEGKEYGEKISKDKHKRLLGFKTSLNNFNEDDFDFLFKHAYELAKIRLESIIN